MRGTLNILVVDDNKFIRKVVSAMIEESAHAAIEADGHTQALEQLEKHDIALILMDIEMPEVDGFQLTKMIREKHHQWIPIIFLSSNESESYLARGIDAGGDDYLTKPVKEVILNAKIRAMARIAQMKSALQEANERLEIISNIDALTGIQNRRSLEKSLTDAWLENTRTQSTLSLLMIDIDFFKHYNDNYGHPAGDECIVRIATNLKSCINSDTDIIARYGGEEFIVVLPATALKEAEKIAVLMLQSITNEAIKHEFSQISDIVTVSIGISDTTLDSRSHERLIQQADKALYSAKTSGRNRYWVFNQ
mgnify:CR=1 FL=1